jgi:hypothetical protein
LGVVSVTRKADRALDIVQSQAHHVRVKRHKSILKPFAGFAGVMQMAAGISVHLSRTCDVFSVYDYVHARKVLCGDILLKFVDSMEIEYDELSDSPIKND